MDEYIQNLTRLQKEDPEQARKQAQASLKRSGIHDAIEAGLQNTSLSSR